jgi:hypothetical protein
MTYKYKILNFDPQQGIITIEFEGSESAGFYAPFINGAYLTGQALEDYIQTLYQQVIPYENRLVLLQSITGAETLAALVAPPTEYVEQNIVTVAETPAKIISVQSVKSTYFISECIEAIVTFDKPIGPTTFVNIMLQNTSSNTAIYLPSQYESVGPELFKPTIITGNNGEKLEMYLGDTTAKYTGPVYPGGISYSEATIYAKTVLNQQDIQSYISSGPIQLISDPVPNP